MARAGSARDSGRQIKTNIINRSVPLRFMAAGEPGR